MNGRRHLLPLFICAAICLWGIFSQPCLAGQVRIHLRKRAIVDKDLIHMGEIAVVDGGAAALVHRIERVVVAKAPLPGKTRRLSQSYIHLRLKQEKIGQADVRIEGPAEIEVTRGSVEIGGDVIRKMVSDFIYANIPWDRDKVRIKEVRVRDRIILPRGKIAYTVEPLNNTDFMGSVPLPVLFRVDGRVKKRILVTAVIDVFEDVVVTARPVKRHRRITEEDVELRERNLAGLPSNVVLDVEEVLGKRAKRNIGANRVLRTDLVETPPLVRRGDVVLLVAESTGLRITALGTVKQREGRRGERIRVENIDSKKTLYGRVVDSKTVKVDF